MESCFRPQILVDKLSKLNSSQQSIETLSHWCIFHMNKANHVVETWEKQFHCAPREQRLAFLYLANDIIQNSKRKGAEFVAEFWKVLPGSLRDVIENGDDFGRNGALRLIKIWEERNVFGSRGQILKEEFLKRTLDDGNRHRNHHSQGGDPMDKLVSCYQSFRSCKFDEDVIIKKCRNSASFIEKVDRDIEQDFNIGNIKSGILNEVKEQHTTLSECIEQLGHVESSRSNLVALLKEALQEQEYKLDQVRHHLQEAQKHSEHASNVNTRLLDRNGATPVIHEHNVAASPHPAPPHSLPEPFPGVGEQLTSTYARQTPFDSENFAPIKDRKSAAAAVAARLASSTSSAQMLSLVLSSLASEEVTSNPIQDAPWEKRARLEGEHPCYVPRSSESPGPSFLPPP